MEIEFTKLNPFVRKIYEDYFIPQNLDVPKEMLLLDTLVCLSLVACSCRTKIRWYNTEIYPNIFVVKIASSGIGKDRPLIHAEKDLLGPFLEQMKQHYYAFLNNYERQPYEYIERFKYEFDKKEAFDRMPKQKANNLVEANTPHDFQLHFENATVEGLVSQAQSMRMFGKGAVFCKNSEFGSFMTSYDDKKKEFLTNLQKAYDSEPFGGKITKGSKQIVAGGDVPTIFLGHTADDWINTPQDRELVMKFFKGIVGRRTFIYYPLNYDLKAVDSVERLKGINLAQQNALHLSKEINQMFSKGLEKKGKILSFTDDAINLVNQYEEEINQKVVEIVNSQRDKSLTAELKGRLLKAIRLMGLFAFLEGKRVIDIKQVQEAMYIIEFYAKYTQAFFKNHEMDAGERFAQYLISISPTPMIKSELRKLNYLPMANFYKTFEDEKEAMEQEADRLGYEIVEVDKYNKIEYYARPLQITDTEKLPLMIADTSGKTQQQVTQNTQYELKHFDWKELHQVIKTYAYMPQLMADGKRAKKNLVPGCAILALDFDSGITLDQVKDMLEQQKLSGLAVTTKSHKKDKHRFRLLMPLKTVFDGSEQQWKNVYTGVSGLFANANDPACSDVSRFYYPSPTDATHFYTQGEPLDWKYFTKKEDKTYKPSKPTDIKDPKIHALNYVKQKYGTIGKGDRDNVLNNVYSYYKNQMGLPVGQVLEIVREVNHSCLGKPFSDAYLEKWGKDR